MPRERATERSGRARSSATEFRVGHEQPGVAAAAGLEPCVAAAAGHEGACVAAAAGDEGRVRGGGGGYEAALRVRRARRSAPRAMSRRRADENCRRRAT